MPKTTELLERFLTDELVLPRTRVEAFLMVALGIKPLSLITLPGELPNGDILGRQIDDRYRNALQAGQTGSLLQRTAFQIKNLGKRPLALKQQLIREAYSAVVEHSSTYKAHINWARDLGLQTYTWEVRPSIRELYVYKSPSVGEELQDLMAERQRIKEETWKKAGKNTPLSLLVYPEEQSPAYLARLGRLLGYPSCCVQAYLQNRTENINVETRASMEVERQSAGAEDMPWAYFVKNFFPCSPECESAVHLGQHSHQALSAMQPALGELYSRLLRENLQMVRQYPTTINKHIQEVEQRGKALSN